MWKKSTITSSPNLLLAKASGLFTQWQKLSPTWAHFPPRILSSGPAPLGKLCGWSPFSSPRWRGSSLETWCHKMGKWWRVPSPWASSSEGRDGPCTMIHEKKLLLVLAVPSNVASGSQGIFPSFMKSSDVNTWADSETRGRLPAKEQWRIFLFAPL